MRVIQCTEPQVLWIQETHETVNCLHRKNTTNMMCTLGFPSMFYLTDKYFCNIEHIPTTRLCANLEKVIKKATQVKQSKSKDDKLPETR
jgi:hypothetical protein